MVEQYSGEKRRATDTGWRKFITLELTITMLAATFVAGGIWVTLSEDIIEAQSSINHHNIELLSLSVRTTGAESDIRLLSAEAARNKESQKEIKNDLSVIDKDIKEILRVVHDGRFN